MYDDLDRYIEELDRSAELIRIRTGVDPVLEIAEITDRISKGPGGGKALLFEDTGTRFPVITNMMGSEKRIAMALGVENLDIIGARISDFVQSLLSPKNSLTDKIKTLPLLGRASRWLPRTVSGRGACQKNVLLGEQADFDILPVLKCWPYDGGRFITLPLVHTVDPVSGNRNVGMYRMQVMDSRTTGMHWHLHKTGERHYREYKKLGRRMPVSVCLGGDPVYTYCATAPLPDNIDEYLLAGFLRNKPVKLVKCLTNELYVPYDCDIVIEGYVDPSEQKVIEGPFGDHTGFYSLEDRYPQFHVTAITYRDNAVYPATLVGVPPQEDKYIALATEKIFLEPMKLAIQPELTDMFMPPECTAHNLVIVSIDKQYPGQAFKVASSMWGAGQMMFNKAVIITAEGTNIRDRETIARKIRGCDIRADILISKGVLDVLDHSSAVTGFGGKLAIDLTGSENYEPVPLKDLAVDLDWIKNINRDYIAEWSAVILGADPLDQIDANKMLYDNRESGVKYFIVTDTAVSGSDPGSLLWFIAANTDPARDITISGNMLAVDARTKCRGGEFMPERVPNVVASSDDTIRLVDSRWKQYEAGAFIESPSSKYSLLQYGTGARIKKMI